MNFSIMKQLALTHKYKSSGQNWVKYIKIKRAIFSFNQFNGIVPYENFSISSFMVNNEPRIIKANFDHRNNASKRYCFVKFGKSS